MVLYGSKIWALSFLVVKEVNIIRYEIHKAHKKKIGGLGEAQLFLTLTHDRNFSGESQLIGLNVLS